MLAFLPCLTSLFLLSLTHSGRAALTNFTIDDTVPDPNGEAVSYDPPTAWNSNGVCNGGKCSIAPDKKRVANGTWHESTVSHKTD